MSLNLVEAAVIGVVYFGIALGIMALGLRAILTGTVPAWTMFRRDFKTTREVAKLYGWSGLLIGLAALLMGVSAAMNIFSGASGLVGIMMPLSLVAILAGVGLLFYATWRRDRKAATPTETK